MCVYTCTNKSVMHQNTVIHLKSAIKITNIRRKKEEKKSSKKQTHDT